MNEGPIPPKAVLAFKEQRKAAAQRGIPFLFTVEEWWAWWTTDDRWPRRGSYVGQLVMARKGDKGPYSPDNVECITTSQNVRDAYARRIAAGFVPFVRSSPDDD